MSLAWITWDPPRFVFTLPYLDRPIAWYGILWVIGFGLSFLYISHTLAKKLLPPLGYPKPHILAQSLCDILLWFVVIETLVGARLGHVFFYDWHLYKQHPLDIIKIWEGGLASHGGTLGIISALWLFTLSARKKVPQMTMLNWMDLLCIPVAFTAGFI